MDDVRPGRARGLCEQGRPKGARRLVAWPLIALCFTSAVGCDSNPTAPTAPSKADASKADTGKGAPKGAPSAKPID